MLSPPYLILKSLHLIFGITWFAALFYIPRLFINQTDALEEADLQKRNIVIDQLKVMTKRLWYIIGWPSLVLNLLFGISTTIPYVNSLIEHNYWPGWLTLKLIFLVGLFGYHIFLHQLYKELQLDSYRFSGHMLRVINEIATLFLFAIVFLGVMKVAVNYWYFWTGLLVLCFLLYYGIIAYKKKRQKNPEL